MIKFLRYLLMAIAVLDVAVLPFCSTNTQGDKGKLFVHAYYVENAGTEEESNEYCLNHLLIEGEYYAGDVIDENKISEAIAMNIDRTLYTSYEVLSYQMTDDGETVTLPHTIVAGDIVNYYEGIRGATHVFVKLDVVLAENDQQA